MSRLLRIGEFVAVVTVLGALVVGSLLVSSSVTQGLETDVGTETDVTGGVGAGSAGGSTALPPAAPVEQGPAGGASSLPSAGNGGYLSGAATNGATYALIGFGIVVLTAGSLALAYKPRR